MSIPYTGATSAPHTAAALEFDITVPALPVFQSKPECGDQRQASQELDPLAVELHRRARRQRERLDQAWRSLARTAPSADLEAELEHLEREVLAIPGRALDAIDECWQREALDERIAQLATELERRSHQDICHPAPARFSAEFARSLKTELDLAHFMAAYGYVALRSSGDHHLGRCLFHYENSPSLHVWADHYHCYGCGAHGDVYDLLREASGLPWRAAVQMAADFLGRTIPEPPVPLPMASELDSRTKRRVAQLWGA